MSKQTTQGFNFTGEMFTASVRPWQESPFSLCFKNGAKLTLNPDGSGTFEGDADEAAQMFFDGVVKLHNRQYQKLEAAEKRIAELVAISKAERELFLRAKGLMYCSGGAPIENSLNPIDAWLYDAECTASVVVEVDLKNKKGLI